MIKGLEALCYLDDIAHGRKMSLDPHELKLIIEKELKALEIIKENKIEGLTLEWDGTWWTICVPNYLFPIAYGRKKKEYDLLKEILL